MSIQIIHTGILVTLRGQIYKQTANGLIRWNELMPYTSDLSVML